MKKLMMTLIAALTMTVSANAMSYEQARNEALFLTDKMAYELNLTDEQYEAAYEINLDYLMGVTGRADVFGTYWERRNLDLSYILLDWQWNAYLAATYFYRPLYWEAGYWHFGIYARYPHRDYFYFGRPHFYATYRGGHAWHVHGGHGYYYGRREHFRAPHREHFGMHDRWNRGDFRTHHNSSTRVTGRPNRGRIENNRRGSFDNNRRGGFENNRRGGLEGSRSNRSYENHAPARNNDNRSMERSAPLRNSNGSFGGSRPSRQYGTSGASNHSSAPSRNSAPARSSMPSRSSSSSSHIGGGSHSGGGSHMGGSRSGGSHSGGSHGGGHFGGHR
jgi:hypothetical protein